MLRIAYGSGRGVWEVGSGSITARGLLRVVELRANLRVVRWSQIQGIMGRRSDDGEELRAADAIHGRPSGPQTSPGGCLSCGDSQFS